MLFTITYKIYNNISNIIYNVKNALLGVKMEQLKKISDFINKHNYIKVAIIVLVIALMSFQLRAQPADMGFTDNPQLKNMFADENGRMYLVALDPYYYLRLTENYYNHGNLGETYKVINGKKIPWDSIQYAPPGHPAPTEPPAIVLANLAIYNVWHSMDSTVSIMNAAYWVPAVLGMLLGIPIFFIVRRVTNSNIGGFVGATIISATPALLYKTSAGFADTPIFEVLPILFIVWFVMEAIHYQKNLKISLPLMALASIIMALANKMWAGWWYGFYIVGVFLIIYSIYSILSTKNEKLIKNKKLLKPENLKNIIILSGTFLIGTSILISALFGINTLISGLLSPIGVQTALTTTEHASGWPNVFTTVAELNKVDYNTIINSAAGSAPFFIISVLGIISSFISMRYISENTKSTYKIDVKYAIILTIWFAVTFYAATKGNRFIGLLAPPVAIGIGIFIGQIINIIKTQSNELIKWTLYPIIGLLGLISIISIRGKVVEVIIPTLHIPVIAYGFVGGLVILAILKIIEIISENNKDNQIKKIMCLLLGLMVVTPTLASAVPLYTVPTYNNGWKESLDWIANETPNNSVITCWWDNGHIYTWATRKMVTFDGGSQNSPRAYWVGRAFATSNENLSKGILRMIATTGDSAYNSSSVLMKKTGNSVKETTKILNEILPLSKSEAYNILVNKYKLTDKEANEVLKDTHPKNPNPDYLITYNRMTDIASVWSMFGFWNYDLPTNTPNDKREMGAFYRIPGGDGFISNGTLVVRVITQENKQYRTIEGIVISANNNIMAQTITYDLNTNKAVSNRPSQFHKIIVYDGHNIHENIINENGTISLLVRLNEVSPGKYYAMGWISTKNLEDSVYSKLHFFDGEGLNGMKLVKASIDPTNNGIQPGFKVYSVDYGTDYLK